MRQDGLLSTDTGIARLSPTTVAGSFSDILLHHFAHTHCFHNREQCVTSRSASRTSANIAVFACAWMIWLIRAETIPGCYPGGQRVHTGSPAEFCRPSIMSTRVLCSDVLRAVARPRDVRSPTEPHGVPSYHHASAVPASTGPHAATSGSLYAVVHVRMWGTLRQLEPHRRCTDGWGRSELRRVPVGTAVLS